MCGPMGSTNAARIRFHERGAGGATNFPAAERRRSRAGGFSPEPGLSSTCRCSASAQPSPTPAPSPPRAPLFTQTALPSPLPSSSSLLPLSPTFLLSLLLYSLLPRRPGCLSPPPGRRGGGVRAAPGACAAQREAFLLLLPGNLERFSVCVRARELAAKRGRI